jgi:hypothetical protein
MRLSSILKTVTIAACLTATLPMLANASPNTRMNKIRHDAIVDQASQTASQLQNAR